MGVNDRTSLSMTSKVAFVGVARCVAVALATATPIFMAGDGPSNKGWEAAAAALEMATIVAQLDACGP